MRRGSSVVAAFVVCLGLFAAPLSADDWAQFGGPNRDNKSEEIGLLQVWPEGGPKLLWTADGLGEGYSTVTRVGDFMTTMGTEGDKDVVIALNARSGQILWKRPIAPKYQEGQGNGPRSTPTIVTGRSGKPERIVALDPQGQLVCLNADDGSVIWSVNILERYQGNNIIWGLSESPLVHEGLVIATPGGSKGSMVALSLEDGAQKWTTQIPGDPQAGYASPLFTNLQGVPQYITFTSQGVVGVNSKSGQPLWGNGAASNGTANCSSPLLYKSNVFFASGYGTGGALLSFKKQGAKISANEVYKTKDMENHHGDMVIEGDYLYGSSDPGILTCLEVATGKSMWKSRSVGKGSLTFADGHLILRSEKGPIALVEASPKAYVEKGQFEQPTSSGRPTWPHPVISDSVLYIRDQDKLFAYDVRK